MPNELPDDVRVLGASRSGMVLLASCIFILFILSVTAFLLLVNAIVCLSLHTAVRALVPDFFSTNANIATPASQIFFFIAPIILMIIEWKLIDRFRRLFRSDG